VTHETRKKGRRAEQRVAGLARELGLRCERSRQEDYGGKYVNSRTLKIADFQL
jgi:hypothetical protein